MSSRKFEIREDLEVEATPDQVWEAIASGPGIDAWFMGRTEVEPASRLRTDFGGFALEFKISDWSPPNRLAYSSEPADDGSFHAWEFVVEGRGESSTVVRVAHSGVLGDNWEDEYDAMRIGDAMYFRKLAAYVEHFAGRTATSLQAMLPEAGARDATVERLPARLGLGNGLSEGDRVRVAPEGIEPFEGVVDHLTPQILGVRTDRVILRFLDGYPDTLVVEEHAYAGDGPRDWQAWLHRVFT
jgi:uncharacterized protein YndB with AHSA1/START domain